MIHNGIMMGRNLVIMHHDAAIVVHYVVITFCNRYKSRYIVVSMDNSVVRMVHNSAHNAIITIHNSVLLVHDRVITIHVAVIAVRNSFRNNHHSVINIHNAAVWVRYADITFCNSVITVHNNDSG